jgi:hypothetical protein
MAMNCPTARTGKFLGGVFLLLALSGCSSLLPVAENTVKGPWSSFSEAIQVFEKIHPYQTTRVELVAMGLDPETNPNITILNYSDVIRRFVPPATIEGYQLPPGVRDCIQSHTECRGFEIDQRTVKRDRHGNFWLDFLNFKRRTHVYGWTFRAVLLMKQDVVIYKITGGQPFLEEDEERRNPLGPFQEMNSILLR